nr:organomercurial lyase [Iamia sp. SCSIO 61187]
MTIEVEDVRLAVVHQFAAGVLPDRASLAAALATDEASVDDALDVLADQRHVVLREGRIVMAHPFAAIPLGFSVMGRETLWWGGCAWDSFAVPHLLPDEPEVLVATRCPGCDAALAWVVGRQDPPEGEEVAHFLVPAAHIWDDVVHTCGNQRLFCAEDCVDRWLEVTGHDKGDVFDLATLWRLARGWYAGRLERGYVRREPDAARDYFRSVGLSGPFWGL